MVRHWGWAKQRRRAGPNLGGRAVWGTSVGIGSAIYGGATRRTGFAGRFVGPVSVEGDADEIRWRLLRSIIRSIRRTSSSPIRSSSRPDMKNIYDGNVTTDAAGSAIVTLPDYFEALNRDFRYQLTVLGQFAQAIVSRKIAGNSFEIRTDKPGVEVSWQVTGIRQDAYARANPIVVEEAQAGRAAGYVSVSRWIRRG